MTDCPTVSFLVPTKSSGTARRLHTRIGITPQKNCSFNSPPQPALSFHHKYQNLVRWRSVEARRGALLGHARGSEVGDAAVAETEVPSETVRAGDGVLMSVVTLILTPGSPSPLPPSGQARRLQWWLAEMRKRQLGGERRREEKGESEGVGFGFLSGPRR